MTGKLIEDIITNLKLGKANPHKIAGCLVDLYKSSDSQAVRRIRNTHLKNLKKQNPQIPFKYLTPLANWNVYGTAIHADYLFGGGQDGSGALGGSSIILNQGNPNPGQISLFFENAIGYKPQKPSKNFNDFS